MPWRIPPPAIHRLDGLDVGIIKELANTSSKEHSTFVMIFDTIAEADDTTKWIESLDGVKSVRMEIMKELIDVQDWLKEEISRRIV